MDKRKVIGRILMLLTNLCIVATIVMLVMDKKWGALVVVVLLGLVSFYVQIDELIHPDRYTWD